MCAQRGFWVAGMGCLTGQVHPGSQSGRGGVAAVSRETGSQTGVSTSLG